MDRTLFPTFAAALLVGCSSSPGLPGGYTVSHGDRGKAWLQNPDGTIAYPGLIKQLHADNRRILLIAYPVSYGGEAAPPRPMDDSCYVAIVVDILARRLRQIGIAEAERLAAGMLEIESHDRPCLEGMPTAKI